VGAEPLRPSRETVIALAIGGGLGLVVFGAGWLMDFIDSTPEYQQYQAIRHGMTEAAVIERLGPPHHEYGSGTAPADYGVPSRTQPDRAVTGRLWVYLRSNPVAYVFFDTSGRVEKVGFGWS
jgi:hypothetical protein